MTSRRLRLSRAATIISLVVMAWQVNLLLNLPHADVVGLPLPYLTPSVSLGEITALMAIILYAAAGWPNRVALRLGWRRVFVVALIGLIGFAALSTMWSSERGFAALQVLHLTVWAAFALLMVCCDWPLAPLVYAFLAGLLLHSLIGLVQFVLRPLVQITPQNSGISVVFNNAQHLQRVYGLSPHPNVLGGHLAVGAILISGLLILQPRRKRWWLIAAWVIIWGTLLLTFSRSGWLAVLGGSISTFIWLMRGRHVTRPALKSLALLGGAGSIAIVIFSMLFQPFLANRIDVTANPYEAQAITERVKAAQLALHIFAAQPYTGVGLAQSLVVMHDLTGTPQDWVHNVPLLITAELGVPGSALIGVLVIAIGAIGVERWKGQSIPVWQASIGGALIALVILMQFDHYLWTMPQGGLLCAWLVGWWMRPAYMTAS